MAAVETKELTWVSVALASDFPEDGGECALVNGEQIAIFNFASRGEWFATSNMCPHKQQMALSRGIIGEKGDIPKVACPFHKKQFSLQTGECLDDDKCISIKTFPVKVEDGKVFIGL